MESREERDPAHLREEREERSRDTAVGRASAPYAEQLRNGAFTQTLLAQCRTIGHGMRVLVRIAWMGDTLRLEAKERRLELTPTPDGVRATFSEDGTETASEPLDLAGDAQALARRWLS